MVNLKQHTIRPWQYFNVLLALLLVSALEIKASFIRHQLIVLPYLVVSTVSAIYGDLFAGILAVIGGTFCVALLEMDGFHFRMYDLSRITGYLIAAIIIFILARKGRKLAVSNLSLSDSMGQMELAAKKLRSQMRLTKKDLKKLNGLNQELRALVDDIMADESLWAGGVKHGVQHKDQKR